MQRSGVSRCIVSNCVVYAKIWDTPTGYPIFLCLRPENENEVRVWGVSRPPPVAESREASEWPRSTRDKGAPSPRTFVGHRNRRAAYCRRRRAPYTRTHCTPSLIRPLRGHLPPGEGFCSPTWGRLPHQCAHWFAMTTGGALPLPYIGRDCHGLLCKPRNDNIILRFALCILPFRAAYWPLYFLF